MLCVLSKKRLKLGLCSPIGLFAVLVNLVVQPVMAAEGDDQQLLRNQLREHPKGFGELFAEGAFADAIELADKKLAVEHRNGGGSTAAAGLWHERKAEALAAIDGREADAIRELRAAKWIYESKEGPTSPSAIRTTVKLCNLFHLAGNESDDGTVRAKDLMALLIQRCRDDKATNCTEFVDAINALGLYQYTLGEYSEAVRAFEESAILAEKTYGPAHPETGQRFYNLALAYGELGVFWRANQFCFHVHRVYNAALGKNHRDTIDVLNCIGCNFFSESDAERARLFFNIAYERGQLSLDRGDPMLVTIAENLALSLRSLDRVEEALEIENVLGLDTNERDTKAEAGILTAPAPLSSPASSSKAADGDLESIRKSDSAGRFAMVSHGNRPTALRQKIVIKDHTLLREAPSSSAQGTPLQPNQFFFELVRDGGNEQNSYVRVGDADGRSLGWVGSEYSCRFSSRCAIIPREGFTVNLQDGEQFVYKSEELPLDVVCNFLITGRLSGVKNSNQVDKFSGVFWCWNPTLEKGVGRAASVFEGDIEFQNKNGVENGVQVILAARPEVERLRSQFDSIHHVLKFSRSEEAFVSLQAVLAEFLAGQAIEGSDPVAVRAVINDLPFRTKSMQLNWSDIVEMEPAEFEQWLSTLQFAKDSAQALLDDEWRWAARTTEFGSEITFFPLNQLP